MKHKFLRIRAILTVISLSFFTNGCAIDEEQEVVIETTSMNKSLPYGEGPSVISFEISGVNNKTEIITMLMFDSWKDFENTAEQLSLELENYDDTFLAEHKSLNEDELDELEISIGYDDQIPLKDFENRLNFENLLENLLIL
jgi:hypothetical protein